MTNNYNKHIAQYLKILKYLKYQKMKFGQLIEYNMKNIFLEKSYTKCRGEAKLKTLLY